MGSARRGQAEQVEALQAESRALGEREAALAAEADARWTEIRQTCCCASPTCRRPTPPTGRARTTTPCCAGWARSRRYADHQQVPHWEIGEALGILDVERGVKLAGSMFVAVPRAGRHPRSRPGASWRSTATPTSTRRSGRPSLVRTEIMVGTGQLPKFSDDAYHLERDDLWAVPTAEVPLTSLYRDEILDEADLPDALHGRHALLPAGGGLGRPGHPWPAAGPRVRQGRAPGPDHRRPRPRTCRPRSWTGPRPWSPTSA